MAVIKVAVNILFQSGTSFRELCIHSDSQAAVLALSSLNVRLKLVKEYMSSLAKLLHIRLLWAPDHSGIAGNCKAGVLARIVGCPMSSYVLALVLWTSSELRKR